MLIIVSLMLVSLFGLVIVRIIKEESSIFNFIGQLLVLLGSVMTAVSVLGIIAFHITAPADVERGRELYNSLRYQIDNELYSQKDSIALKELVDDAMEWNRDLRTLRFFKESPWTNVFVPMDLSEFDYIRLDELPIVSRSEHGSR